VYTIDAVLQKTKQFGTGTLPAPQLLWKVTITVMIGIGPDGVFPFFSLPLWNGSFNQSIGTFTCPIDPLYDTTSLDYCGHPPTITLTVT
jgi:hypothetical protein